MYEEDAPRQPTPSKVGQFPKPEIKPHVCAGCKQEFEHDCQLKYHIRRYHFRRISYKPYADSQSVNQVWCERVGKSNTLIEIKKVSENKLLMRKLEEDTTIQPTEMHRPVVDLREQYPASSSSHSPKSSPVSLECNICQKKYKKRKLTKHFKSCHPEHIKKQCDKCDQPFKRLFACASHICPVISEIEETKDGEPKKEDTITID